MEKLQREICLRFGVDFQPVLPGSKLGIALQTQGHQLLNALRLLPENGTKVLLVLLI